MVTALDPWFDAYPGPTEFRKDLAEENEVYEKILTRLGMAKGLKKTEAK